ncbi:hypothetical protein BV898_19852, partial [Hypsibius exemplaris]
VVNKIVKFVALLILNVWLIIAIERANRSPIAQVCVRAPGSDHKHCSSTNIVLLSSVAVSLVCQFPALMLHVLTIATDFNAYHL